MNITAEFEAVKAAIARALANAENLRPLMADIAEELLEETRDRFRTEVDPEGRPWAPLDPTYLGLKLDEGLNPGILKATGLMGDTIFQEFGETFAQVGSNRIQATTHQYGDASRGIPERPFLGLSVRGLEGVVGAILDHLELGD